MVQVNELDFRYQDGKIELVTSEGQMYGSIAYQPTDDDKVIAATSTYVSSVLRGQGAAGRLLDKLVDYAENNNLKIHPVCSYVVKKFDEEPEKYAAIDAR